MADANTPRDAPASKIIAALNELGSEMAGMRADVAGISGEVAGLRGIVPRTGAATGGARVSTPGEAATAAERTARAGRDSLDAELRRLEILKAETGELERQQAIIRGGGVSAGGVVIPPGGYRPGGGRAQEAANFGEVQRQRILAEITGRPGGRPEDLILPQQRIPQALIRVPERRAYDRPIGEEIAREERLNALAKERAADEQAAAVEIQRQTAALAEQQRMVENLAVLEQQRVARQRTAGIVAGLAPGERQATEAALTYQGGLKGYPGLPVSYVNQGPAFRNRAAEAEFGAYRGGRTETRDIDAMTARMNRLGIVQGEASQQMRRHGALTTEFLTALARGETTLQEFGYQISATTGKFAGWTAAAAAVYGFLGAVHELGAGATETASGVATLSRFFEGDNPLNKQKATQGFRDVSADLNVPIKDVASAQAVFARSFKDQDDSLTAAKVSIQAYKLDQISAADSQRYFTAIVQEFGLSAKDLPVIFDQISAAQRRMGARVAETLPAVARSAAAVKNAGGDMNQLIALAATAQVASGQTGNVVGTALSRAASNFFRRPDNAKIIESFGLDPNKGFTQLLIDAVKKSQDLTGIERTQLARAIGGPQFGGRVFQTLLGQQDRLQRTLYETSPDRARGSAGKETEDQLKRIDEQISKVGNNLQRIGSSIAESGALAPLGLMLKTLNGILSTTNNIIEAFDHLPAPIRDMLQYLLEARLVMAGLRRTNFGTGIADATGLRFLGPSAGERARREAIVGARQAEQTGANAFESTINQAQMTTAQARAARTTAAQLRLQAEQETNTVRRVALQEQAIAAEARYTMLQAQSAEQEALALQYQAAYNAAIERRVALQKGTITAEEALAAEAAVGVPLGVPRAAGETAGVKAAETEARTAEAAIVGRGAKLRQAAGDVGRLGGRMARGIGNFVGGLGLFGQAFLAFTVGQVVEDAINSATDDIEKASKDLDRVPHSLEALKRVQSDAADKAKHGPQHGFGTRIAEAFVTAGDYLRDFPDMTPNSPAQSDIQTQADRAKANAAAALIHARQHTLHSSLQNVGLANREIIGYAQRDVDNIDAWGQTRAEFNRNFDRYLRDVGVSIEGITTGHVDQKVIAQINEIRAAGDRKFGPKSSDPFAQFRHMGLQQVAGYVGTMGQQGELYGADPNDFHTMLRALTFEVAKHGQSDDPKVLQQIAQIQEGIAKYIGQMDQDLSEQVAKIQDLGADTELTVAPSGENLIRLSDSTTSKVGAAYDKAIARAKREKAKVDEDFGRASSSYRKAQQHLDDLERQKKGDPGISDATPGGRDPGEPAGLDREITKARAERDKQKDKLDKLRKAQHKSAAKIQEQIDKWEQAKFDVTSSEIELRSSYRQSLASDKSDQIEIQIQADKDLVAAALKYHGPGRWAKIMEAQTKLNNDLASQADQNLQDIQKAGDLRTSRITGAGDAGDRARLQSQLRTAQQVLAAARGERANPGKKDHIRDAEIAVNGLILSINQQAQQDAKDAHDLARQLYDSKVAIRTAGLTDPIAIDKATLDQDIHDLSFIRRGDFKSQIEYQIQRNQQLAKIKGDRTKLRQDEISGDYETAQFEHNIGRLSDDAYIGQLRNILHMKGITKQMKRQLLEEIYRLTHEDQAGGLDLNVGNIRLPTIYEVRRATRAGRGAGATVIHNNPTVHVAVSRDVDIGKLGAAMEETFGGAVMANFRAAGVA